MKQAGLSSFKPENYSKDHLRQVNIHKYRNICPDCGEKGNKTGEAHHENPNREHSTLYVEWYDCENNDCDASSYFA
jgi:hypothetical protein